MSPLQQYEYDQSATLNNTLIFRQYVETGLSQTKTTFLCEEFLMQPINIRCLGAENKLPSNNLESSATHVWPVKRVTTINGPLRRGTR